MSSRSFESRRFFNSAAASFVNVTTIILSALTPDRGSARSLTSLSVRTAVLPLPAAAETINDEPSAFMAFSCWLVHFMFTRPPFSQIYLKVSLSLFRYLPRQVRGTPLSSHCRRYSCNHNIHTGQTWLF